MPNFYLGCAVWAYKGWVGDLFPAGTPSRDFLRIYSQRLTTVEGNTTFYATPDAATVQRWADETPDTFRFCFKLPRDVSHSGPLAQQIEATRAFTARLAPLGPRLGPFFLQLPPGYGPRQIADLEQWLAAWQPEMGQVAVEVRHLSWWAAEGAAQLAALLAHYNAGRVLLDTRPLKLGPLPGAEEDLERARDRKPDVPLEPVRTNDQVLLRYISHPDIALNAPLLDAWASQIATWLTEGATVYAFMHCPVEARSPAMCRELYTRLAAHGVAAPLPWLAGNADTEQATLPGF